MLDDRSKEECRKKLYPLGDQARQILDMIDNKPSETDRKNLGNYLKQLSSRRAVNLEFLPEHFRKWCGVN